MSAIFFNDGKDTYIISNWMSILNAGFHSAKSYYNKSGSQLEYFVHDNGCVLERISSRNRQPINKVYKTKEQANAHFKTMNDGKTFDTGKWVTKK